MTGISEGNMKKELIANSIRVARGEEGVTAPVRQLIAAGDGADSCRLQLPGKAITGWATEMRALEQGCELPRGMPGQQHDTRARLPCVANHSLTARCGESASVVRMVNGVRSGRSSIAMVVSSGFSRARLAPSVSTCICLARTGRPASVYCRKHHERGDAEGRGVVARVRAGNLATPALVVASRPPAEARDPPAPAAPPRLRAAGADHGAKVCAVPDVTLPTPNTASAAANRHAITATRRRVQSRGSWRIWLDSRCASLSSSAMRRLTPRSAGAA